MKFTRSLLLSALAAGLAVSGAFWAFAQQSAKPADELPDAPQATAAALIHPNGPTVVMDTSMGRITCQFYQQQVPKTVANFIALAEGAKDWTDPVTKKLQHHKPLYDGTTFHRVIPEFMIQGGDPAGTGMGDPGYAFNDEFDPNLNFDTPGKLAMANSGPNTNGSQFFITEVPFETGNQQYTLFGQCDDASVTVVKAIARVQHDSQDKPLTPVVLKKVTIVREGQPLPPSPGEAATTPGVQPKSVAISAGVAEGLLVKKVAPIYPHEARAAHVWGTVVLRAIIGTDGHVSDLNVISGPEVLRQAAIDAVKQWEYRPYLLNHVPIEVSTTINIIFNSQQVVLQ
jgi:peptidyl-prolyl cis-trans isomerase A (cyclophilin A)